jgi:endonuclease/exonuclease/phosphatase family metal-dependent hydrolase
VRVATLNLWGRFADWPARLEILRTQLPPLDVDVYLLQEVVWIEDGDDQLASVAELLGYPWTARVIAESRPDELEHEGVAIAARLPLHRVAVWPLPPSRPTRHRLEAEVEWEGQRLRVTTLHAAVSAEDGRDEQIRALGRVDASPLVAGGDLNTTPDEVRDLTGDTFEDPCHWDDTPTWPVDRQEFVRAWEEKLGAPPRGEVKPRRLDYLLYRGVRVTAAGTLALRSEGRSASDHQLVWADVLPAGP